jgi:hypothetical protein
MSAHAPEFQAATAKSTRRSRINVCDSGRTAAIDMGHGGARLPHI